jgi:hypothetical protein
MAIAYSYKINAVRVKSEGSLVDVVKEIDVTVTGADGAATFSLPTVIKLSGVDPENFTAFANLTEEQLVSWVEGEPVAEGMPTTLDGVKAHIAYVVAKEAERLAMEQKPLPWVPAPDPAVPVPPPTA